MGGLLNEKERQKHNNPNFNGLLLKFSGIAGYTVQTPEALMPHAPRGGGLPSHHCCSCGSSATPLEEGGGRGGYGVLLSLLFM